MQKRQLGRTGLQVSLLTFGCGAVGGLMTKGDPKDQERAVARALELDINHFDTAPQYGQGASERNLGRTLGEPQAQGRRQHEGAHAAGGAAAHRRFHRDVHGGEPEAAAARQRRTAPAAQSAGDAGGGEKLTPDKVLGEVVPALRRLRDQGKTRFLGLTAIGDTAALHRVVNSRAFDIAQVPYNALNPSPGEALPKGIPRRTTAACSSARRPPAWVRSASACWPAGR